MLVGSICFERANVHSADTASMLSYSRVLDKDYLKGCEILTLNQICCTQHNGLVVMDQGNDQPTWVASNAIKKNLKLY